MTLKFTLPRTPRFGVEDDYVSLCAPRSCPSIVIAPASELLSMGVVGTFYAVHFSASGGQSPYLFSVASGALPPGLVLTSAGKLSGTPTMSNTFIFSLATTDARGCAGLADFSVRVAYAWGNPPDCADTDDDDWGSVTEPVPCPPEDFGSVTESEDSVEDYGGLT